MTKVILNKLKLDAMTPNFNYLKSISMFQSAPVEKKTLPKSPAKTQFVFEKNPTKTFHSRGGAWRVLQPLSNPIKKTIL